jgi:hypothetical protein
MKNEVRASTSKVSDSEAATCQIDSLKSAGTHSFRPSWRVSIQILLLLSGALLCRTAPLAAQSTSGSIAGTVTEQSGGALPGLTVQLTNLGTKEQQAAPTNQAGFYQFVNIPPGNYSLAVSAAGFKTTKRGPIELHVDSTVEIDVTMTIGSVDQIVEVTAATPLLQAETSSLGEVVDQRKTTEIPLNGRNPLNLTALVPSVVPQGGAMQSPAALNPFAWGNYQIGGAFANQSATFLDGAPLNTEYLNIMALVPSQDSIQEFKVETNNLPAEYGRLAGGAINFRTKSGTDELHGSAWEFLRNKLLNANTFFGKRAGLSRPAFTQNQYGFNLGGPVILPHLYDGRKKTFFFVNWEAFALRYGQTFTETVPTVDERGGNLSALGVNIYDPLTTCGVAGGPACAPNQTLYSRAEFSGAVIPQNRLNPTAVAFLNQFYPLPNTAGAAGQANWTGNANLGGNNNQTIVHLDHAFNDVERLSARYTLWNASDLANQPFGNGICLQRCGDRYTINNFILDNTYMISAKTILDAHFSFIRFEYHRFPVLSNYNLTSLNMPSSLQSAVEYPGPPSFSISGFDPSALYVSGSDAVLNNYDDTFRPAGSLTRIAGNHTLKFGGEFLSGFHNFIQANNSTGSYSFSNGFTQANGVSGGGGAGLASFLLGYPASGTLLYATPIAAHQFYMGVYGNDDWRVSTRLTFHLGLRWENNLPWTERHNRQSYFDPTAPNPVLAAGGLGNIPGSIDLVASSTRSARSPVNPDFAQISPRAGLTFAATNKTVFSLGYGLLFLPSDLSLQLIPNNDVVNSQTANFIASLNGNLTPANTISNPFPSGILQPVGRSSNYQQVLLGNSAQAAFPNNPYGYAQQWNVALQQQYGENLAFSIAYAGAKGTHLPFSSLQIDQLPDQDLALGSKLLAQVPNPYYGIVNPSYALGASTVTAGQLLRPFPQFNGFTNPGAAQGASTYNALQIKAQRRFAHGASINLAYTWSKLLSNTDTQTTWLESGSLTVAQDYNNLRAEKSLSANDTPQRAVVSYVYDLPVGRGQKLLGDSSRFVNGTLGGWGIEGITTLQSGFPLQFGTNTNLTNSYGGGSRPNYVAGCNKQVLGRAQSRLNEWFNTACFTAPPAFTFGNEPRYDPQLRAAGQATWDTSAFKNIPLLPERKLDLQFRTEIFNVFNRVQFGYPGQIQGNSNFGIVTTQLNQPRLIQFALRLNY